MQLTRQTDYAIRILMYLAALPVDEITQIQQVCDYFGIPRNHASKIVVKLVKLGYVQAYRGQQGGIALGKPAGKINLRDVIEALEPTLNPVNCLQPGKCRLLPDCRLKKILGDAVRQYLAVVGGYTLADVTAKKMLVF